MNSSTLLADVARLRQLQKVTGNTSRLLPGVSNASSNTSSESVDKVRATSPIALRRFEQRYEGRRLTEAERAEEAEASLKRWEKKRAGGGEGQESYRQIDLDEDEEELMRLKRRVAHLEDRLRSKIDYEPSVRSDDAAPSGVTQIPIAEYDQYCLTSEEVHGEDNTRRVTQDEIRRVTQSTVGNDNGPSALVQGISTVNDAQNLDIRRSKPGRGKRPTRSKTKMVQAPTVDWNDSTRFSRDGIFSTLGSRTMADEMHRHVIRKNETGAASFQAKAATAAPAASHRSESEDRRGAYNSYFTSSRPLDITQPDYAADFAARKVFGDSNGTMTAASVRLAYRRRRQEEEARQNAVAMRTLRLGPSLSSVADVTEVSEASNLAPGVSKKLGLTAKATKEAETKLPTTSVLEQQQSNARILSGLSYDKWCFDASYKLSISNQIRNLLRGNVPVILRVPLTESETRESKEDVSKADGLAKAAAVREEAKRSATLLLSSILNECIIYSNETGLPPLSLWGSERNPLYPEFAEVLIRPHRKYADSDYQEIHRTLLQTQCA